MTATCPLTGHPAEVYARVGEATYLRDPQSGIIFLERLPGLAEMTAFVEEEYAAGLYRDYVAAGDLKRETGRRRLELLAQFQPGRRLLDVGCAAGFFLEAALDAGFDAQGVELSTVAVKAASERVRPLITIGDVNQLLARDPRRFDVVTAFDIIEHTFDPAAFLRDAHGVLEPGGLIMISTPDTGHTLRPLMGRHWPMLQPHQHTFLFSQPAMAAQLKAAGFEPLVVQPTHKVLTIDYLFGQLRQTNPVLSRLLGVAKRVVPSGLRHRAIPINIGELIAVARRR